MYIYQEVLLLLDSNTYLKELSYSGTVVLKSKFYQYGDHLYQSLQK
jgi:hypothetical protein